MLPDSVALQLRLKGAYRGLAELEMRRYGTYGEYTYRIAVPPLSLDEDEAAWREAINKHEIEGVHVRADGFGSDVAKSYQVNSLPSYYLVDSQGLIVGRLDGVRDTDEIVAMIEKSL